MDHLLGDIKSLFQNSNWQHRHISVIFIIIGLHQIEALLMGCWGKQIKCSAKPSSFFL